jgi:hypothetical protein
MDAVQLITTLTPLIVWLVTWIIRKYLSTMPGWVITTLVVPALSAIVAWVSSALGSTELTWLMQFGYGLLAVFVNEFIKQIKPATP